jgi:hypothetical protein
MNDYYQLLGILKTASRADIKKAYRGKIRLYHPDLNAGNIDEATRKTARINEAYDYIMDHLTSSFIVMGVGILHNKLLLKEIAFIMFFVLFPWGIIPRPLGRLKRK